MNRGTLLHDEVIGEILYVQYWGDDDWEEDGEWKIIDIFSINLIGIKFLSLKIETLHLKIMHLNGGVFLQGGKYRIESVLGQGGFGITYLAEQTGLERKVAIKEFFMKELCDRDEKTLTVSVPSSGSFGRSW